TVCSVGHAAAEPAGGDLIVGLGDLKTCAAAAAAAAAGKRIAFAIDSHSGRNVPDTLHIDSRKIAVRSKLTVDLSAADACHSGITGGTVDFRLSGGACTFSPIVAGAGKEGYPLSHGLQIKRLLGGIEDCRFTRGETFVDYGKFSGVDDKLFGIHNRGRI